MYAIKIAQNKPPTMAKIQVIILRSVVPIVYCKLIQIVFTDMGAKING